MTDYQIKALDMYLDVIKKLNNMSNKFASIGIIIDQSIAISSPTVQDDFNFVIVTLDDFIKGVMNLNYYDEEMFFMTISEYINGRDTKENIIMNLRD